MVYGKCVHKIACSLASCLREVISHLRDSYSLDFLDFLDCSSVARRNVEISTFRRAIEEQSHARLTVHFLQHYGASLNR